MILIKGIPLKKIAGIALWPFIIVRSKSPGKVIINHETIHLKQQAEMLVIFFYLWYLFEWFYRLFQYRNQSLAYYNISFEREAYANESNLDYLKSRKFWSFIRYI